MPLTYVPATGNASAQLMVLCDYPGYEEEQSLTPLAGSSRREFERVCKTANINPYDCWISNVSKFSIPFSPNKKKPVQIRAKEAGINLTEQIDDLRREIQTINPNCILALGPLALWALTGKAPLDDYRGSILNTWLGKKLVATYHPANFIYQETDYNVREYWKRQVSIFDFKRALVQSHFPELRLPSRNLHIARNSSDVYSFINDNRKSGKVSIDIEARHCVPWCIGLAFSKYEGLAIRLWDGITDSDLASIWIQIARLNMDAQIKKLGQNFKYDQDKITKLGLPIDALYSDTMLKAFCINAELPKNLAFNTSLYTEEPFYKNEGMYEGSEEDLLIGCARDSCVTYEVDDAQQIDIDEMGLEAYYRRFLMPLHQLYLDIENEGFHVDEKVREELLRKYIHQDESLRYEMFKMISAYVNVNSWKQVSSLLYDNLKIPFRVGTGEEVLTSLLNNVVKDPLRRKIIDNILESRRIRKAISTYLTAITDYDGKMRTTYFICLETGRSSTGQQEPPIRPNEEYIELDDYGKKKKKKKSLGMAFQTISKHGDYSDVRRMLLS